MAMTRRLMVAVLAALLGHCGPQVAATTAASRVEHESEVETLRFEINEGQMTNAFFRRGPVAAHLALRSGAAPRVVVAFPAGNGGAAFWLRRGDRPVALEKASDVEGVERPDGLRGVTLMIAATSPRLVIDRAVLGSVRVIRDVMHGVEVRPEMTPAPVALDPLRWSRTTLDGGHRYELVIEPHGQASARVDESGAVVISAAPGQERLTFRLTALSDDPPLTPIPMDQLLRPGSVDDEVSKQVLAFLSYREKLLAGSWRFLTYFGRDTLITVTLLMPVAHPSLIEAGLASVLARLGPGGEVAHEEEIGEFAVLRHLEAGEGALTTPVYDDSMVDSHYLLAPVAARYLLHTPEGQARAAEFLARPISGDETMASALRRNLNYVVAHSRPFAEAPGVDTLIHLEEGRHAGNWRDSAEGLGGGRVPFDVNVVLVPAALAAAAELLESGLLGPDAETAAEARQLGTAWQAAEPLFRVELSRDEALRRLRRYTAEVGLPPEHAVESLPDPVVFPALALNEAGEPIAVMHTDEVFALLFSTPPPEALDSMVSRLTRPFPAGLLTPIGLVVSNPALVEDRELRSSFDRGHYHGTVVWPWQQAALLSGVRYQLRRGDLPSATRAHLEQAEQLAWDAIEAGRSVRTTELWTWEYDAETGRFQIVPFGQAAGHRTESNAAQLWSTVQLAFTPP